MIHSTTHPTPIALDAGAILDTLAALRTVEHVAVVDDGGGVAYRRYHWTIRRPGTGASTISRESFATYAEAAQAAVDIARCKGLPCDPIVELVARDAEVDSAQDSRAAAGW